MDHIEIFQMYLKLKQIYIQNPKSSLTITKEINLSWTDNANVLEISSTQIMINIGFKCMESMEIFDILSINKLTLKYKIKIKRESQESHILFDTTSNTFCHIISNMKWIMDSFNTIDVLHLLLINQEIFLMATGDELYQQQLMGWNN